MYLTFSILGRLAHPHSASSPTVLFSAAVRLPPCCLQMRLALSDLCSSLSLLLLPVRNHLLPSLSLQGLPCSMESAQHSAQLCDVAALLACFSELRVVAGWGSIPPKVLASCDLPYLL